MQFSEIVELLFKSIGNGFCEVTQNTNLFIG